MKFEVDRRTVMGYHSKIKRGYEGVRSTSGPTRATSRGPGGCDIKLEQHLVLVRAASAVAIFL